MNKNAVVLVICRLAWYRFRFSANKECKIGLVWLLSMLQLRYWDAASLTTLRDLRQHSVVTDLGLLGALGGSTLLLLIWGPWSSSDARESLGGCALVRPA